MGAAAAAGRLGRPLTQRLELAGPLAAFAAFGVFWGGWAVLVPTVQTAVGASNGALGAALLGVAVGSLPAMVAFARLLDRGLRRPVALSLAALAGCGLLPGFAGSVAALGGALVAVGACSGAVDVAINTDVAGREARTGRRSMQLAHGLYSVGVIAGAVASGLLRQAGAGRPLVLGVLGAALLAAASLNLTPTAAAAAPQERERFRLRPALVAIGAVAAAALVVESGIENWSALFLQRTLGAGAAASAAGPAAFATAMAAGRLLGQRASGRVADRTLLAAGALVSVAGLLLASASGSVAVAAAGFFLGGAGVSVAAPILFGAGGRGAPERERASALATVTTVGYLGFLVGPPLVGGLAQAAGLRVSFVALAVVAAVVAATAPRLALGR